MRFSMGFRVGIGIPTGQRHCRPIEANLKKHGYYNCRLFLNCEIEKNIIDSKLLVPTISIAAHGYTAHGIPSYYFVYFVLLPCLDLDWSWYCSPESFRANMSLEVSKFLQEHGLKASIWHTHAYIWFFLLPANCSVHHRMQRQWIDVHSHHLIICLGAEVQLRSKPRTWLEALPGVTWHCHPWNVKPHTTVSRKKSANRIHLIDKDFTLCMFAKKRSHCTSSA